MSLRAEILPAARVDIDAICWHLAHEDGDRLASRFVDDLHATMRQLLRRPGFGRVVDARAPGSQVRRWRVRGFPNYLIYYVAGEPLTVVRVLHGARDEPRVEA